MDIHRHPDESIGEYRLRIKKEQEAEAIKDYCVKRGKRCVDCLSDCPNNPDIVEEIDPNELSLYDING